MNYSGLNVQILLINRGIASPEIRMRRIEIPNAAMTIV
jgi:hypothetical protein